MIENIKKVEILREGYVFRAGHPKKMTPIRGEGLVIKLGKLKGGSCDF